MQASGRLPRTWPAVWRSVWQSIWQSRFRGIALRVFLSDNGRVSAGSKAGKKNGNTAVRHEYLQYLRVEKGLRPLSCEAYARDLEMFAEFLEGTYGLLETAQGQDVAGFLEHLHRHQIEPRSIARKLSCLRGFYKWLLLDKRIRHDPTVHIESPKAWRVLPKALATSEIDAMLDTAQIAARHPQADAVALRDRAILELLYAGGVRVSELTGLHVADLQLDAGRMLVRGKGDKERMVAAGPAGGRGAGGVHRARKTAVGA